MSQKYQGLPAAAGIEQSIALAQLLILRDLERLARPVADLPATPRADSNEKRAA